MYCPAKALQVSRVSHQQAFFAWKMFHLSNSCYKSIAHHMLTTSWLFKSYIGGETNWAAMKMSKTMAVPWQIVLQLWNLGREARNFFCNCKVFLQNANNAKTTFNFERYWPTSCSLVQANKSWWGSFKKQGWYSILILNIGSRDWLNGLATTI